MNKPFFSSPASHPETRRQRSDGERSRAAILKAAAALATTRGLIGLSLGSLAEHLGMSKSGLYAHFGSKEELELATIEAAAGIFEVDVIAPILAAPPGLHRLNALVDSFLSHVERRVFPGGCFFAAVTAELASHPGRARDRLMTIQADWMGLIGRCLNEAVDRAELTRETDVAQTVFEVDAMLVLANLSFVITRDATMLARARAGVRHAIEKWRMTPAPATRPARAARARPGKRRAR